MNNYRHSALFLLAATLAACIDPLPTPGEIPEVRCGDGVKSPTEACDDGNLSDRDACTNLCEVAVCNDGIKRLDLAEDAPDYEVCDDGNSNENDDCTTLCKPPACHDGIKQYLEACDDGNAENTDACVGECVLSACGDGFVQAGVEACDPQADDAPENCGENCQLKVCGNGIVEGEEECDDGNTEDADSCLNSCALARCGDGIQRTDIQEGDEGFEACDDGNLDPGDTCSVECLIDDHGNDRGTATTINPGETLRAHVASGDSDWFKVVAPLDGNYVFVTTARPEGEGDAPPLECSAYYPDQEASASQHVYGAHNIAGCRVSAFRAAGEILFLQLYSSGERVYDVALKPICGNGFHDPSEQCDPSVGQSPTNTFRCRMDCRLRQQEALGPSNICLVDEGETLCWGSNQYLLLGRPPVQSCLDGHGTELPASRYPIRILSREANVSTIALAGNRACVVARDGDTLACWGYEGNLAPARLKREQVCHSLRARPHCADEPVDLVAAPPLPPISGIALGENHQCGIWNGQIGCWGVHQDGNMGAPNYRRWPTIDEIGFIVEPADAVYVQAGSFFNCAIDSDQQLWCWGRNNYGQVGSGTQNTHSRCRHADYCEPIPVRVGGGDIGPVVDVVLGFDHACALNEEGEVWCWGKNDVSQTGSESDPDLATCYAVNDSLRPQGCVRQPTRVEGIPRAIELSAGYRHTCIISVEGAVWCWGDNRQGQIGTGFVDEETPVDIPRMVAGLPPVASILLGGHTSCARQGSRVWCWGSNSMGQFGVACGSAFPSPRRLTMLD